MMLVCLLNFIICEKSLKKRRACCQSKWTWGCENKNRESKSKTVSYIISLSSDRFLQLSKCVYIATKSVKTAKCDEDGCKILDKALEKVYFLSCADSHHANPAVESSSVASEEVT